MLGDLNRFIKDTNTEVLTLVTRTIVNGIDGLETH
jgi:hypothetical protein